METHKYRGLFNPGGCLTSLTFRRFMDNSLLTSEKVRVEDHLRHCLICSDALEGFKMHQKAGYMQSDLEFLSGRIRRRYSFKKDIRGAIPASIVISLFVFIIILLIVYYVIRYLLIMA